MKNLKESRTNAQYYVNREFIVEDVNKVKKFVLKCKEIFHKSDFEKIRLDIIKSIK